QGVGGAEARLYWSGLSVPYQAIPQNHLYPPLTPTPTITSTPTDTFTPTNSPTSTPTITPTPTITLTPCPAPLFFGVGAANNSEPSTGDTMIASPIHITTAGNVIRLRIHTLDAPSGNVKMALFS